MIELDCKIDTSAGVEHCTLSVREAGTNLKGLTQTAWLPRGQSWDTEIPKMVEGIMTTLGVDDPDLVMVNGQRLDSFVM